MANDFMTMTPGSEVGDALQEILVRRRQAKQQDFLNSLQTKTQADNEAYRNMQAQSLADERQAHEAQMQSEDWNRRAQLHGGEAAAGLSPEDLQYGLQHGWLSQDHIAALTGDQAGGAQPSGAPTASEPTYHWGDTDKSRAAGVKASQSKALQALMDSPAFQALPPLNQLAIRAKIVGGEVPGGADFTEAPKPTTAQRYKLNKLTGKVEPILDPTGKPVMGPENSPITEWGEQPNSSGAPAANDTLAMFDIPDPSGAKKPDGSAQTIQIQATPNTINNPKTYGHLFDNSVPGIRVFGSPLHKGNEPNPPAKKPIASGSTGAFQKLTSLLAAGNDPMDAGVKAARAQAISSLVDPVFKQDVSHFVQRSESGVQVTPDYVHQVLHAPDGVDPQQYENAVTTLLHASGIF